MRMQPAPLINLCNQEPPRNASNAMMKDVLWYARVLASTLPWYGALQLFGFVAWPFFFGVFNRLPDRGYAAAKVFGLLIVAYATFLLSHGAGQGFTWETVALASGFLAFVALVRMLRVLPYLAEFVRLRWRVCVTYEVVFAGAFAAMVLYRAGIPQITFQVADFAAEKFTDFGILNGLMTSRDFPPHDPWLSGFTMNYYYFGHFLWATVARFSGYGSEIAFNLGLASIFAYALLLSFSLGYNVSARLRWGFFAAFLIGLSSNLDGALQMLGVVRDVCGSNVPLAKWYTAYDFWRSSRAIENTITEFPAFSFILGDLHAHLSSLVLLLGGLLLCLQMWRSVRRTSSLLRYEWENLDELLFAAIVFGALFAANSWDVVTFAGCVVVALWCGATSARSGSEPEASRARTAAWSGLILLESLLLTIILAVAGITLLFRPFWLNFLPPNTKLALLPADLTSSPVEFTTHWLLLLAPAVVLVAALLCGLYRNSVFWLVRIGLSREHFLAAFAVGAAIVFLMLVYGAGAVAALSAVAFLGLATVLLTFRQAASFRLLLGFAAFFCAAIWFADTFYFDDIFSGSIERINTVFKIYYSLWPVAGLMAVLAASRLGRLAGSPRQRRWGRILLASLVILGGIYPVAGSLQRHAMAVHYPRPKKPARMLDGLRYLAFVEPDDYAAILWLRAYTEGDARLVEAPGKQYEYAGRIGTMTGRPSLGGWLYHEWGWRGDAFEIERDRRFEAAEAIYESSSLAETARLLLTDKLSYVVVGHVERERYPTIREQKFATLGKVAYKWGRTTVYRLSATALEAAAQEESQAPPVSSEAEAAASYAVNKLSGGETTITLRFEEPATTTSAGGAGLPPVEERAQETSAAAALSPASAAALTSGGATLIPRDEQYMDAGQTSASVGERRGTLHASDGETSAPAAADADTTSRATRQEPVTSTSREPVTTGPQASAEVAREDTSTFTSLLKPDRGTSVPSEMIH
jgi:YYY domain-containing protein